jgi:hypothetical protein
MTNSPRSKSMFALLVVAFSILMLFCGGLWWHGEGAPLDQVARISPGMNKEQVIALLGHPHTINRSPDGSESWCYCRCTWCMIFIHLTPAGTVDRTVHDH